MLANLIRKLVAAGAAPVAPLRIVRVDPAAKPAPTPPQKPRPQLMRFLG